MAMTDVVKLPPLLYEEPAAKALGISVATLQRIRKRGEIAARRIGRRWRYTAADLIEYQERQKVPACPQPSVDNPKLRDIGSANAPTPTIGAPHGTRTAEAIDKHDALRLAQLTFGKPS